MTFKFIFFLKFIIKIKIICIFNNIFFILNKPQLSENIGACARAMKNFNFSNLVIINPKPSFPNDKIFATSVGAKEIIQKFSKN